MRVQKDTGQPLPLDAYAGVSAPQLPARIGGKAAGLVWLAQNGFAVPPTWILEARPFLQQLRRTLPPEFSPRSLLALRDRKEALERMSRARDAIVSAPLPTGLRAALERFWTGVQHEAPWGLAVRSSATCEDSELTAMAGLVTSVMGVRGAESLASAVRQVWASVMLPRALEHLARFGVRDVAMAVVIQPVVVADASGVLFTRAPAGASGDEWPRDECLINATLGLGAPVVNGAMAPDVIRLAVADGRARHRTVAAKHHKLVVGDDGPAFVAVPPSQAREPALSRAVERELARLAARLERRAGAAHDAEFVVKGGEVLLVQSRPVVGRGFPSGGDEHTVWSRANVGEALPGAATPLTWSVAQGFSERGFRQAFGSLGCSVPDDASLVANVHGRFYLNLTQFMRIAAQVPGLDPNTWLEVGGGSGAELLQGQLDGVSRRGFYRRLPRTVAGLAIEQAGLGRRVRRFERDAWRRRLARRGRCLERLDRWELAKLLREVRAELDHAGTLMLACASASLASHLALQTALRWLVPGQEAHRARSLTAGVTELESARPGIALARLALVARRSPEVADRLVRGHYQRVEQLPAGELRRGLEAFLDEYGDRAIREPELATPRWREEPKPVFSMLAAALTRPDTDPIAVHERARERADRELGALEQRLPRWRAGALRVLVDRARRTTAWRETMRAWVTRALSDIRWVAQEVDRRLCAADRLTEPGGAFFCTCDELLDALESGQLELGRLIELRRAEHARDVGRPDPPVTFVGRAPAVVLPSSGTTSLAGLAASEGVVEGPVRVMLDGQLPERLLPGEILVARTTDVGLTPMFLVAAGVITELGGPLSHASIVAREYGVPAVVNVAGATSALRDGEWVRVDGTRGTVERLTDDSSTAARDTLSC